MQNFSYRLVGLNCLDALTGTQKLRNNQDARCRTLLGQFGRSDSHANARRMFISRRLWRLASVLSKHVDSRQTGRHEGRWRRLLIFDSVALRVSVTWFWFIGRCRPEPMASVWLIWGLFADVPLWSSWLWEEHQHWSEWRGSVTSHLAYLDLQNQASIHITPLTV